MRTFAAANRDRMENRYAVDDVLPEADGKTPAGAKTILASRGGKKAARHATATLWEASRKHREGFMPTARINAPLRVLEALETAGLIERAQDGGHSPATAEEYLEDTTRRGVAIRFRLTEFGLRVAAEKSGEAK